MARYGGSISLRLTAGFIGLLVVFGAALLLTLYYLDKVRRASEETRVRQDIRREALEIAQDAEELFSHQHQFIRAEGVDRSMVVDFQDLYGRIEETLHSLQARPVQAPERAYLRELADAAAELRALFLNDIVDAKIKVDRGTESPEVLTQLEARSRQAIDRINGLNDLLAYFFEVRTRTAEDQATGAWDVSIAIAKIIFPMALLISLLVIYYTHRSIVRPVSALVGGTKALAAGKLGERIEVHGSGEFRELADSFNRMARNLEINQKQLVEAEKLATVGQLAAGVAHEINNPIAVILGYTQMLLADLPEDAPEKVQLEAIVQETRQCRSIVDGLLDLSRPSDAVPGEVINPSDVVTEVFNVLHALQLTDDAQIEASVIDRPISLTISRLRLRQLVLNLARNALEALKGSEDGRLTVEGYVRPRGKLTESMLKDSSSDALSFLLFIFTDNGPGITPEDLTSLFEPFFTTKEDGIGLGLTISYSIARAHGGFIGVQSAVGEGTAFTVGVPLAEEG